MKSLKELEEWLGDPSEFILTHKNRQELKKWAIAKGHAPVQVHSMSGIELSNMYCASANKEQKDQLAANEMFVQMVQAFQIAQVDPELVRSFVAEEIAKQPPKKIEIISPSATVVVDGLIHYRTELILKVVSLNHPVMMVGPAGCGKTSIGEKVAKALNLPFYVTSTINETHELSGFVDGYGKYHTTPYRQAYEFGGVWIADEIDAWDASALLAANSGLANGFATFPDLAEPLNRHPDFRMIATANTFGSGASRVYVGRNELDAASLDRFAVIDVDYDLNLEQHFSRGQERWLNYVWKIRKAVNEKNVRHVVSSRAIIMGAMAIEIGLDFDDVRELYLFKGMSKADRKKIEK